MAEDFERASDLEVLADCVCLEAALAREAVCYPRISLGAELQAFAGEVLALDEADPRDVLRSKPEGWGIAYFSPRYLKWERLIAEKGVAFWAGSYAPVLPTKRSPERKKLKKVRWPIHIHSHSVEMTGGLDRLSIRLQELLRFPFVAYLTVNNSKEGFLYLVKADRFYRGNIEGELRLVD